MLHNHGIVTICTNKHNMQPQSLPDRSMIQLHHNAHNLDFRVAVFDAPSLEHDGLLWHQDRRSRCAPQDRDLSMSMPAIPSKMLFPLKIQRLPSTALLDVYVAQFSKPLTSSVCDKSNSM